MTLRHEALAFASGVVATFVVLGLVLTALRAAGEQLGWGFQLQNPYVVAALAGLFTLIGLNLAGVFEVGSLLPNRLACARARHPLADDLLTGVLEQLCRYVLRPSRRSRFRSAGSGAGRRRWSWS